MIAYNFTDTQTLQISPSVTAWLENIIRSENRKVGDINYIFGNDEYILKINRDFLQHDYYTDIITFDYVKGKTVSGDIFVSLQRISDNAKTFGTFFENELLRVLAHGILHLCGYADKSEEDQKLMRAKEDFYLDVYRDLSNVSRATIK